MLHACPTQDQAPATAEAEGNVAGSKKNRRKKQIKPIKTKREKFGLEHTEASLKEIQRALKLGQAHAQKREWPEAVKHLLVAWDAMPEDLHILTVLAHALVQLGVRDKAIAVLERALNVHEPNAALIGVMANMALEMGMNDISEKLNSQLVQMEPKNPVHYINLLTALNKQEKYDSAIDIAQSVLPLFPDSSDLWNVLASSVMFRDGNEASIVFYEEALRLDPNNFRALNNISNALTDRELANKYVMRALELAPDSADLNIARAFYMFREGGDMEPAWKHYSYRLHSRRAQNQNLTYTHKLPMWQGEPIGDKTVFATCEQGIGDEVLFATPLRELEKQCKQLIIGVDPRLVSIYQRSFPDAIVDSYLDRMHAGYRYRIFPRVEKQKEQGELQIDYAIPFGELCGQYWRKTEDVKFPEEGYLVPDPERKAEWAERLGALEHPINIGISWQSGTMHASRKRYYLTLEEMLPLLKTKGVNFINLQYSKVSEELKAFEEKHGITIHHWDDVDLRADIEANLAIMSNLDLAIGPAISTQVFAASVGLPVWWFTVYKPWWTFGGEEGVVPWARNGRYFSRYPDIDWERTVGIVTEELQAMLEKKAAA